MILILTASIMYWSLLQKSKGEDEDRPPEEEGNAPAEEGNAPEEEVNPPMDEASLLDGFAEMKDEAMSKDEEDS